MKQNAGVETAAERQMTAFSGRKIFEFGEQPLRVEIHDGPELSLAQSPVNCPYCMMR